MTLYDNKESSLVSKDLNKNTLLFNIEKFSLIVSIVSSTLCFLVNVHTNCVFNISLSYFQISTQYKYHLKFVEYYQNCLPCKFLLTYYLSQMQTVKHQLNPFHLDEYQKQKHHTDTS